MNTWSQEQEEELNSLINRLLPREAGNYSEITRNPDCKKVSRCILCSVGQKKVGRTLSEVFTPII